jgi:hypothetical protein
MSVVEQEFRQEIVNKVKTRKALNSLQYSPNGIDVLNGYSSPFSKANVLENKKVT